MDESDPKDIPQRQQLATPAPSGFDSPGSPAPPTSSQQPARPTHSVDLSQLGLDAAPELVRVGRYHLQRQIATGGMGTVYEAVQDQPRRTVALKLMRVGIASRANQRR